MKTVDQVIGDSLVREGWPAFTDRPSDKGGPTRGGVTLANYNRWLVSKGLAPITVEELKDLPEASARAFMLDEFSRPFVFVADEGVFALLVDWAITSGPDDPARALQTALKERGIYAGAVDGAPGAKTRAAWMAIAADLYACELIERELIKLRGVFYLDCALVHPDIDAFLKAHPASQLANLRGWLNRTFQFL